MAVNLFLDTTSLNPLYYAVFDRIAPAANKYMATLFNGSSTNIIMVSRIFRLNWQFATVTDNDLDQYLARITARTAGASVTIRSGDTADTVPSGISADTGSTAVTEDHIIRRVPAINFVWHQDLPLEANAVNGPLVGLIYERQIEHKGPILRNNEGLSIRNITAVTTGSVSYVFEFSQVYA